MGFIWYFNNVTHFEKQSLVFINTANSRDECMVRSANLATITHTNESCFPKVLIYLFFS